MDEQPGLIEQLTAGLGKDAVLTDPDVTASYSRDMMPLAPNLFNPGSMFDLSG